MGRTTTSWMFSLLLLFLLTMLTSSQTNRTEVLRQCFELMPESAKKCHRLFANDLMFISRTVVIDEDEEKNVQFCCAVNHLRKCLVNSARPFCSRLALFTLLSFSPINNINQNQSSHDDNDYGGDDNDNGDDQMTNSCTKELVQEQCEQSIRRSQQWIYISLVVILLAILTFIVYLIFKNKRQTVFDTKFRTIRKSRSFFL